MYWRPPDPERDPLWYRRELRAIGLGDEALYRFDHVALAVEVGPPGRRFLLAYRCQRCGGRLVLLRANAFAADTLPDLREAQFLLDHRHPEGDDGE